MPITFYKAIYNIISICLLCGFIAPMLSSCSIETSESVEQYEWNIWFYLAGDNDLSPHIEADFQEIITSINSKHINICIQIDRVNDVPTQRYRLLNGTSTLLADLGEVDSTDPNELSNFITWAKSQGAAKKNILIISSHGNGWDQATGASPLDKPTQRAMFSDEDNNKPAPNVYTHNHLIADAIQSANVQLDILGLDASLMATIETMYEFSELAPILVASEEIGNANGWNYKSFLNGKELEFRSIGVLPPPIHYSNVPLLLFLFEL